MRNTWQPDGLGYRARIGVLTPNDDAVPESEFWTTSSISFMEEEIS